MQGCATSITLGASSSQHSGTRKASGVKLSCKNRRNLFGDTTRTHTYIYMSHTQIKKNIKYIKTTAVWDWKLVTSCGQSLLRICNVAQCTYFGTGS